MVSPPSMPPSFVILSASQTFPLESLKSLSSPALMRMIPGLADPSLGAVSSAWANLNCRLKATAAATNTPTMRTTKMVLRNIVFSLEFQSNFPGVGSHHRTLPEVGCKFCLEISEPRFHLGRRLLQ